MLASSCIFFLPSVRPAVCPQGTTRFPLDGLLWNLTFVYFPKICWEKSSLIKVGQQQRYCTWRPVYLFVYHYHYHHVHEGLGLFPVSLSSKWNWSLQLFLGCCGWFFSGFMGFTYQHLYNPWDHVELWPACLFIRSLILLRMRNVADKYYRQNQNIFCVKKIVFFMR